MSTSLSELVDNMSGKFNSTECKSCTENNRYEESEKKKKKSKIEGLIEKFPSMHQFCNGHINKFILLLRKGAYP